MLIAVAGGAVLVILAAVAWFVMNRPAGEADPETEAAALESAPDLDAPVNDTAPKKTRPPDRKPAKPAKPSQEPSKREPSPLDALSAQPES